MKMEAKTSEWRPGPTVCRCCLTEGCYKDISTEYFWMGKREVYAEMLADTLNLTIAYSQSGGPNSNSRLICEPCISRLRDAVEFKRQVEECEKTFLQHLDPSTSGITQDASRESILKGKQVKVEVVKLERLESDDDFQQSRFSDDDDDDGIDDIDDQPLTKLAKTPKKESVDLLDLIDNAKVAEKRKSTTKVRATPVKKAKPKKETKTSKDKPEKKKKEKCDPVRRNAEIIIRYTTASPFRVSVKTITCVYCGDLYQDPGQFRAHMATEHKVFSLHMAFAKLPKSDYVKADIMNLQCRLCQNEFKCLQTIGHHLKETHSKEISVESPLGVMPFLLDKDNWNCAVCDKNVPSLLHLNKHTITHFLSFVCEVCGKSYIASTGLLTHVRSKHENEYKAYCKRCQVIFPSMKAKQIHKRSDKRCMTHCCSECPERFPSYEYKQRHMIETHGLMRNEYNCVHCPLTFTHRQAFYDHFKKAHSVDCAVCNHCGLKFASTSKLNRHMKKHVT